MDISPILCKHTPQSCQVTEDLSIDSLLCPHSNTNCTARQGRKQMRSHHKTQDGEIKRYWIVCFTSLGLVLWALWSVPIHGLAFSWACGIGLISGMARWEYSLAQPRILYST